MRLHANVGVGIEYGRNYGEAIGDVLRKLSKVFSVRKNAVWKAMSIKRKMTNNLGTHVLENSKKPS